MTDAQQPRHSRKHTSGSETRQKQRRITVRLAADEREEIAEHADREGLTIGSYIRERALQNPRTQSRRKPSVDIQTLARMLGEVNRVGSNINQLLKRVNFNDMPQTEREYREAIEDWRTIAAGLLAAMGRKGR